MDVIFIRHGESYNNVLHEVLREQHGEPLARTLFHQQRKHDPSLTPLGHAQAAAVADRLAAEYPHMAEVWVSFLSRALGTAAAIHEALPHTNVVVMRDINECGGSYRYCPERQSHVGEPGSSRTDVAEKYPSFSFFDPSQPASDAEGWYDGEGKELPADSHKRAKDLIARVEAFAASHTHRDNTSAMAPLIGVVTHGDFFRVLLQELLHSHRLAVDGEIEERIVRGKEFKGGAGAPTDSWIRNTSVTHFCVRPRGAASEAALPDSCNDPLKGDDDRVAAMDWGVALLADASHLDGMPHPPQDRDTDTESTPSR